MYLVHVDPKLIPPESGLRIAPTGIQNTIELDRGPFEHEEAIAIIDAITHTELFGELSFTKARELLLIADVHQYKAGEVLFQKGDPGDTFLVVMSGAVDILIWWKSDYHLQYWWLLW